MSPCAHRTHAFAIGLVLCLDAGIAASAARADEMVVPAGPDLPVEDRAPVADERLCRNEASVLDRLVGMPSAEYVDLLAALDVPARSPATASPGDLVVERHDLVDPETLRIVVRKPVAGSGAPFRIGVLPADPVAAHARLKERLEEASETGASTILFPPDATIRLSNPKPGAAHIVLEEFEDVVIDFNGSTIELLGLAPGIVIENSRRLLLRGGTLKSPHLLASVAVAETDATSPIGVHLRVLSPFVQALEASFSDTGAGPALATIGRARRVGERWEPLADDNVDVFVNRGDKTDRFAYRGPDEASGTHARFEALSIGSRDESPFEHGQPFLLLHLNNAANGIVLDNANADVEDISLVDMTLMNIAGMGVFGEVNRGLHLDGVEIVPDPDNPLSLLGSSSDAFHINNNGGDIVVENSRFGPSADDLLTVKGNWWRVSEIDAGAGTAEVVNAERRYGVHVWARAGDRLVATDGELKLIGATRHTARSVKRGSKRHTVQLGTLPAWLLPGTLVANPDLGGGRMIVRNTRFESTRAQGILIQTRHVVVEGNTFTNIAGPAIELNFALTDWHEGVTAGNVLIRDNRFESTGAGRTKPPFSVYFHERDANGTPIRVIGDVRLADNLDAAPSGGCATHGERDIVPGR